MRSDTHRYLITYDIPDDKRRTRISKTLSSYGERMQFSVFLVDLDAATLVSLTDEIESLIELSEDAVLVCDLGISKEANRRSMQHLGRQAELPSPQSFII